MCVNIKDIAIGLQPPPRRTTVVVACTRFNRVMLNQSVHGNYKTLLGRQNLTAVECITLLPCIFCESYHLGGEELCFKAGAGGEFSNILGRLNVYQVRAYCARDARSRRW